ncbi:maleylpyruvate isomerase family mycothiol-dependent enzyme [Streptomyces calidiresistens]|uniref:Maleylpyruvate isomerase family mycothiol-dependent enzyme n=1 Tax=Streptomyces calidiresistens TaxID=1485586 RepID=A0A7W3T774_9ACTN|nr:maleylpyruvate isomerase family mycothiol-dependent enzyme [Streptomyces calidiresistens]MBB0232204.1 maleylpyruvate isomerase family mycothiol-dependent enzyme [Streptomyces calidiresistens]
MDIRLRDTDTLIDILAEEGGRLRAAAELAGPDAAVPTCPGWRVRELVRHQGRVHRWAAALIAGEAPGPEGSSAVPVPAPDEEPDEWYRAGLRELVARLRALDPAAERWTFLPGSPSARHFWARRQAHETTVHRVDAELAAGRRPSPIGTAVALDGIDELLTGFHSGSRSRARAEKPVTLGLRASDAPGAEWTVHLTTDPPRVVGPGSGDAAARVEEADCLITGPASRLLLLLWNRDTVDDPHGRPAPGDPLILTGDPGPAHLWRDTAGV